MRCSACEPLLAGYVEAALPPAQMQDVARHVAECPACAALLAELRVVDALLHTAHPVDIAPNFTFAVMANARALAPPHRVKAPIVKMLAVYVAGAWVVFSGLILALANRLPALAAVVRTQWQAPLQALHALAGTAAALAPAAPVLLSTVAVLAVIDLALLACIVYFSRNVRPRLAARSIRSERP